MGDEFELFNPSDFESIRLTFDFKNLSTDRSVPNSSDVSLLEVGDKTLTVEIPFDNCAVDNHVLLKIFKTDPASGNQVPIFNPTAKMIKNDKVGDGDRLLIVLD
ncbi:MAG TPA: hypothetical protein PLH57_10615, partial [Oligoflexia bacterium]|nr:hypothetical protein [Oligoflexia bacterium]